MAMLDRCALVGDTDAEAGAGTGTSIFERRAAMVPGAVFECRRYPRARPALPTSRAMPVTSSCMAKDRVRSWVELIAGEYEEAYDA